MQSVPTVAAFWQGQIADVFQGALPESEVKRFVESLLKLAGGAMPSADLLAEAKAAMEDRRFEEAGALYSALLQEDPENGDAWGGLIRVLMALGHEDQARRRWHRFRPSSPTTLRSPAPAARWRWRARAGRRRPAATARGAAWPPTRTTIRRATILRTALNATGKRDEAAAALLDIVKRDRAWNDDGARMQLLKFFEAWGMTTRRPLAARRKLSALLFS